LAEEVKKHLIEVKEEFKLSFIGHSMGGLIIRSAIPRLQKYRVNFESYISICSPHLGYLYEPPSLIKMGLWVLSQIQKCESVSEVEMKDNGDLRRCYLYKLATNGSLNWFKKVSFVASSQDSYVPYESARV
jgi:alpha-beta hydrolase superfamily lysophospholipase